MYYIRSIKRTVYLKNIGLGKNVKESVLVSVQQMYNKSVLVSVQQMYNKSVLVSVQQICFSRQ